MSANRPEPAPVGTFVILTYAKLVGTSYLYAHKHGIGWNLSFIGNEVEASDTLFDSAYMRRLYAYGPRADRRAANGATARPVPGTGGGRDRKRGLRVQVPSTRVRRIA